MATTKNKRRADGRKQASIYLGIVDGKKKYKYVYTCKYKKVRIHICPLTSKKLNAYNTNDCSSKNTTLLLINTKIQKPTQYRIYFQFRNLFLICSVSSGENRSVTLKNSSSEP